VRSALNGTAMLSGVYGPPSSADQVVEWAVPYSVLPTRRVEIVGARLSLLSGFMSSILSRLPQLDQGLSAIVDSNGTVIGSPTQGIEGGERLPDPGLLHAMAGAREGDYTANGADRRFASSPIAGTQWRVVLSATHGSLYAEANGARRTVPWIIFGALAVVAIGGLLALGRATRARAEIARREASRRYALEINDNVIQRLTVAKLALETGQEEVSHEKITDTLREAQRLVNQLIGDRTVESGDLRRQEKVESS
jgi:hypothetical protein